MATRLGGLVARRALLSAGFGGIAAVLGQALGRPATVLAGSDGDVVLGQPNSASAPTGIASNGSGAALEVTTSSTTGWAVHAASTDYPTVFAESSANAALYGVAHGSNGAVLGQSVGTGPGVMGTAGLNHTTPPTGTGIFGYGNLGVIGQAAGETGYVGVQGFTGTSDPREPDPVQLQLPTGTYGEADGNHPTGVWGQGGTVTSGFSTGVYGEGDTGVWGFGGWGVFGASDATGTGVYGLSAASVPAAPAHTGVFAYSDSGYGLYARATTGTALYVNGKARFSRSGRTSVTAGHSSRKVTMAGVTTASYIIATPQTKRGVFVQAVVPGSGYFTIYLNKVVSGTTYVGFLVIN